MNNIYIALIINNNNEKDLTQYNLIIDLLNFQYPNNKLIFDKYLIDGTIQSIHQSLDNYIKKYPNGNRVTISITSTILTECSKYFKARQLDILNISINATSNKIKELYNAITYTPFNQYAVMSLFMVYTNYQMNNLHILYDNTTTSIGIPDYYEQILIQARLLNINVTRSYLKPNINNYNIKPKSLIIMLALTNDIKTKYVNNKFLKNIPNNCFIALTTANTTMTDIFGNIPTVVPCPTNINYTITSQLVYNTVKNNPTGYDYTSYIFYDVLYVINYLNKNKFIVNKNNFISINPYSDIPPAWMLNTIINSNLNSVPYGNYTLIFTKNVIINKDNDLFLKYYQGGQLSLPNSNSIFKIIGITPNNNSLINYDNADFYKIYDKYNKKIVVRYSSDITNFPPEIQNLFFNIGINHKSTFIYKYNNDGYFIELLPIYPCNTEIPVVNLTMSKKPIKLYYK